MNQDPGSNAPPPPLKPARHSYPLATILLCIRLVMFCNCSLRSAAAVMRQFTSLTNLKPPSHVTIQNWILKYGVAQLGENIEKRDDWCIILDNTIEFGTMKCLLVLGIPLSKFRRNGCQVKHADVVVLGLTVTDKMNAAKIKETLDVIAAEIGAPAQAVTDHGSDIKRGVEDFIKTLPNTPVYTYDITHKTAIILKHHLKDDTRWEEFVRKAVECKRLVLQTECGHMAPPKPSDKARWLNLDAYVTWAQSVRAHTNELQRDPKQQKEAENAKKAFGWLDEFADELRVWEGIVKVLQTAKDEVKTNGLDKGTRKRMAMRLEALGLGESPTVVDVITELVEFAEAQTAALPDGDKWLGASDIIESVFGKYKRFSQRASVKGVGKTVLTMPVFTGELSVEKLLQVMEDVRGSEVTQWILDNLGVSLFSKRKRALNPICRANSSVINFDQEAQKVANY